jgi:hypothetical protein
MYTWLFHIPNTLIYVFQCSASQHGSAVGYDFIDAILNLMGGFGGNDSYKMRRHSFSFNCLSNCLLSCQTIVWSCELILVSIVMNCAGYAWYYYIVPVLEAPHSERQPKPVVVKKIKSLYSSINCRIYGLYLLYAGCCIGLKKFGRKIFLHLS